MAHTIQAGPLPNIVIMTAYGEIEAEDVSSPEELGMTDTPKYLLIDASKLGFGLPDHFLTLARQTPLGHPNCLHAAVVIRSDLLKHLAAAVAKLVRARDKVTFFARYDEALNYLVTLAQQAQTPG